MGNETKDRFPILRKILGALGLSAEAIDDIIERILDLLSESKEPAKGVESFPYQIRDDFLSPAELSFYLVLRSVVADRAQICPKVALGDLFFAKTGDHRQNRISTNKIDRKHIDFLLCEPKTLRPLFGVELDDKSHAREDRQKRDSFVDGVFVAAKLPLLRVPVKTGYAPSEIEMLLRPYFTVSPASIPSPSPVSAEDSDLKYAPREKVGIPITETKTVVPQTNVAPACSKCGATMSLRTAKSGQNSGGQFWGCSNFPRCRSVLPYK